MRNRELILLFCSALCFYLWGYMGISLLFIPSDYVVVAQSRESTNWNAEKECNSIQDLLRKAEGRTQEYSVCFRAQDVTLSAPSAEKEITLYGIDNQYLQFRNIHLVAGRFVDISDISISKPVIVIDQEAAMILFPGQEVIGEKISIEGTVYTVIGIHERGSSFGESSRSLSFIPYTAFKFFPHAHITTECLIKTHDIQDYTSLLTEAFDRAFDNYTVYSMSQQRILSLFPVLFTVAIFSSAWIVHQLKNEVLLLEKARQRVQALLYKHYWHEIPGKLVLAYVPWVIKSILPLTGAAVMITGLLQVIALFSAWIPAQISSLSSWQELFWRIQDKMVGSVHLNCMESSLMNLYQTINWLSAMIILSISVSLHLPATSIPYDSI